MVNVCKRFKIVANSTFILKHLVRNCENPEIYLWCSYYCNSCDRYKKCEVAWNSRGEKVVCKNCGYKFLCMTTS